MDKNAVVIGMRVVPHDKTVGTPWGFVFDDEDDDATIFFKQNGYLLITRIGKEGNEGNFQLAESMSAPPYWFAASDFEPYIEPEK
jgi:hypothetical protein